MTDIRINALLGTAVAAIAIMGGSNVALAQDAETAPAARTGTVIVVTARKIEESIQDVPVAIAAFTKEEMQRRSISELEDVALQTPGLVFEDYSNGGFGTPTIRGATQFTINGLEQNVSVFLDGVYIPRQYAFDLGSTNLERIEVVKGPQSALYGANAFAGAINYVTTNRSLTEISASGELEVSEDKGFDLSGKLSVPLIDNMMAMRFGIGFSKYDGSWENNFPNPAKVNPGTNGNIGGYDNQSLSVGASFRPVDALTIDFDYYNFDVSSETGAQHRLDRAAGDFNCSVGGYGFAFNPFRLVPGAVENQLFCGEIPVDPVAPPGSVGFPDGYVVDPRSYGLESESEIYRVNVAAELTDQISANYMFGRASGNVFSAGQSDRNVLTGANGNSNFSYTPVGGYKYDTHEMRLQYQGDSGLYVMVGAFLMKGDDLDVSTGGAIPLPGAAGGTDPANTLLPGFVASNTFTETETKAVFGRISVPLMDERLVIELEGRYTDERKEQTDLTLFSPYVYEDKYFTPRANVSFKVTDDNLLYASVAEGIKSGGINSTTLPGNAVLAADEQFYGPDKNWTYEIGLKNTFMNGLATLNIAAFYIDWSNLQLQTAPTGGNITSANLILNVGGASIKGVEVDGRFEVVEGLVLNGGLAYIDAKYSDGTTSARIRRGNLCFDGVVCNANGDVGGNELQRNSKFQWNVGASFDAPISDSLEFFSRVDVAGQSKQYVSEINVATIAPRTLTNGRIGVRGDRWSFSVWGKNLFDEKYVSNAFYIGGSPFFSVYVPTAGNRRRLGATVTFDY
jgi:iron complex outermembrane receptor protein